LNNLPLECITCKL